MNVLPQFGASYGSIWSGLKVKRYVLLVGVAELAWFLGGMCQDSARLIPTGPKGGPTRGSGPTFLV